MLIKYIRMHNIRSYISQEIRFPDGSILLSGDIGSGKSTVLLAIEFALFGIKRGDLSGEALLRNGKKAGMVELGMELEGKEIAINRKLKRTNNGVVQDSGWIEINGKRLEASPVELKAKVLEILGYPDELLTKGKDILFRYTVYTPQEQMKQILLESKEARLETLRKVFQIDKYKRIRENALIYNRDLKEKRRELEGKASDLDAKKALMKDEQTEMEKDRAKLAAIEPMLVAAKNKVEQTRNKYLEVEAKARRLNDLKREFRVKEVDLINKADQHQRNSKEIEALENEMKSLQPGTLQKKIEESRNISVQVQEKNRKLQDMQKQLSHVGKQVAQLQARIGQANEIKAKISNISLCPICEQEVGEKHRHGINEREDSKITAAKDEIDKFLKAESAMEQQMKDAETEIEAMRKKERETEALRIKWQNYERNMERQKRISDQQDALKKEIGAINVAKNELSREIKALQNTESEYMALRKQLDEAIEADKKIGIEYASLKKEAELRERLISAVKDEVASKEEAVRKSTEIAQYMNWIDSFFVDLMSTMEKHVMAKIHGEFNELFRQWFATMVEDETLSVRIDDEFTPIVEQDGYETDIGYLSGGERTSCALAYRLSLNRVINDLVSTIKTKDIIILDEPTDGFSSEQLDRVRSVVEQIAVKQIIIVSHEPKIESFVQNVIRIRKNEHISQIFA
ncbi:SMC family ATPase [Candidatus Woesearchaeota archaeon]|nr:SMC family ATPase [Candidatus Woesearchaeota archaeon]